MKSFNFSRTEYEYICEEAMLNEKYRKLLKMKILDYSRAKMADELGYSIDTIDDMVAELKKKIKKAI
jgi:hypothetical protein